MPTNTKPARSFERYLTTDEAAAIARAPRSTVHHWLAVGKLRSTKPGRRHLIAESELRRFLGEDPREDAA